MYEIIQIWFSSNQSVLSNIGIEHVLLGCLHQLQINELYLVFYVVLALNMCLWDVYINYKLMSYISQNLCKGFKPL